MTGVQTCALPICFPVTIPVYNKILYNSYPNENDLLSKDFHDVILYCFTDPITLVYQNGLIGGSQNLDERDYISVKKKD